MRNIMPNTDFSEIDNLHSEWSRMEKAITATALTCDRFSHRNRTGTNSKVIKKKKQGEGILKTDVRR